MPAYKWTIMVYMSGDNNLSEEMVRALNDLAIQATDEQGTSYGLPERVAITIQYDAAAQASPTSRFVISNPASPLILNRVDPALPRPQRCQDFFVGRVSELDPRLPPRKTGRSCHTGQFHPVEPETASQSTRCWFCRVMGRYGRGLLTDGQPGARVQRPHSFTIRISPRR